MNCRCQKKPAVVRQFPCRSEKSPFAAKRLNNVIDYLTFEVFRYTCRGLYENHKFLLVLFLTLKKDLQIGYVKHNEFGVFIKGSCFLLTFCTRSGGVGPIHKFSDGN